MDFSDMETASVYAGRQEAVTGLNRLFKMLREQRKGWPTVKIQKSPKGDLTYPVRIVQQSASNTFKLNRTGIVFLGKYWTGHKPIYLHELDSLIFEFPALKVTVVETNGETSVTVELKEVTQNYIKQEYTHVRQH